MVLKTPHKTNMSETEITDIRLGTLESPRFVRPFTMSYKLGNYSKKWEMLQIHDSVAVLIFNVDQLKFVFVRQFRPPVFIQNFARRRAFDLEAGIALGKLISTMPGETAMGYTYELCAGIIDKEETPERIACAEVFEETGYRVNETDLTKIISFKEGVGTAASTQTMFFVEVKDSLREGTGGGLAEEGEMIEVLHLTKEETAAMANDEAVDKPLGLLYALQWFKSKDSRLQW